MQLEVSSRYHVFSLALKHVHIIEYR